MAERGTRVSECTRASYSSTVLYTGVIKGLPLTVHALAARLSMESVVLCAAAPVLFMPLNDVCVTTIVLLNNNESNESINLSINLSINQSSSTERMDE